MQLSVIYDRYMLSGGFILIAMSHHYVSYRNIAHIYEIRISSIHVLFKHIISQFEIKYGQGTVIYTLKNPYMDILVIYKLKSYLYVVFLKSCIYGQRHCLSYML